MYYVKVDPGKERARVRDYYSGFLPSYKPAFIPSDSPVNRKPAVNERGIKRLVIPGCVFMLRSDPRSKPVDDSEWAIIEAISDAHPSELDPESGKIVKGPLVAVNQFITKVDNDCIQVSAMLLGIMRQYWLRAEFPSAETEEEPETAEEPKPEEKPEAADSPAPAESSGKKELPKAANQNTGKEDQKMEQKREYTQEEQAAMLAKAEEIGIHAAAREYGVAWQTLAFMKRRANKEAGNPPAEKKTAPKKTTDKGQTKAAKAQEKAETKAGRRKKTEAKAETPSETDSGTATELRAENAVLKEKIVKLEAKIKKLQKAISDLIAD